MANTPQAKKRIRRNERRAEINGNRVGRIRTFVKKVIKTNTNLTDKPYENWMNCVRKTETLIKKSSSFRSK